MESVVFVLSGFPRIPGGGHKIVYQYANALSSRGVRVRVVHARPRGKLLSARAVRELLARIRYVTYRQRRPRWFNLRPDVEVFNRDGFRCNDVSGFDTIVATSVRTASFVSESAALAGERPVYLLQHFEDFSMPTQYVEWTWRLPFNRVVVSDWLLERAQHLGVTATCVPNAIDVSEFPLGSSILDRPRGVLTLISEQAWKRSDIAMAVLDMLHASDPGIELHAFGVGARPSEMNENVRYYQDPSPAALRELYQRCRVYFCTSDFEGFGLPVAEALASGAAAVSTRNGGVESFAGATIPYVEGGDASAIYEEVLGLINAPDRCQSIADAGGNRVRERSFDASVNALVDVLFESERQC